MIYRARVLGVKRFSGCLMSKLPSFQFYPGDWMKDPSLRRCSKAAKGVWIDMICLSFECEERGVFASSGEPWPDSDIAAAVGGDITEVLNAIAELLAKGVCSRNSSGALFCRRVVRDEQKRRLCSEAGQRGGGNPNLTFKGDDKGESKGASKGAPKPVPKASSSSSLSSSSSSSNKNLPSTNEPLSTAPPPDDSQEKWGLVGEKLRGYGLARVTDTIRQAKKFLFGAQQILDWIAWLEDPAFPLRKEKIGPGAIVSRIETEDARFWEAHFGWPPVTDLPADPPQSHAAYPIKGISLSARDSAELAELNAKFGARFDALSDLEVQSMIGKTRSAYDVGFRRSHPASRLELLRKMK